MPRIESLKPNVTRAQAIDLFRRGMPGLLRRIAWGSLRSVAEAYVPFRIYRVEVSNGRGRQRSWFGLDAVSGTLDLYRFERAPTAAELMQVETRNRPDPTLEDVRAVRLLEDKLRRLVFQTGFFRVRHLRFGVERSPLDLHVPYWIGFYDAGETVRLHVLDAVRRRFEGGKVRALFEGWLASEEKSR